jgi:sugar (pentulose or hexulose) kinase
MNTSVKKSLLIGLDLGTSAIKGVLTNRDGEVLAQAHRETDFIRPESGFVEINPEQHYKAVCEVIRELSCNNSEHVIAFAMAAAAGNALLADAEFQPLTNIISWLDKRAELKPPSLLNDITSEGLRQVTGWPCNQSFPLAQLAWLKENKHDVYEKSARFCMNTDWLNFRFTGKWQSDFSTSTPSHLVEQTKRRYYQPFMKKLGIASSQLPELIASGVKVGTITRQAAADTGLPEDTVLVSGSFDHPTAARACGILTPGKLMLSCGTSWAGFFPETDRNKILDAKLLCDPFLSASGGPWGAIFSVPYIGQVIDWYLDNQIAPNQANKHKLFDELAAKAPAGSDGLKIDLREPPRTFDASPALIARAVMEGAANLLQAKLEELKANENIEFNEAVMVGGPANSPIWPGIVAETTGLKVYIGKRHAGAKGAAMLAGIGAGIYNDEFEAFNLAGDHHG